MSNTLVVAFAARGSSRDCRRPLALSFREAVQSFSAIKPALRASGARGCFNHHSNSRRITANVYANRNQAQPAPPIACAPRSHVERNREFSMSKELIVSVNGREKKIAIVEDDLVTEFY